MPAAPELKPAAILPGPLDIRAVSVKEGGAVLLNAVSAQLHPGELCALLGPSGAGKSTLIKVLLGLREARGGEVRVGERPIGELGPIGYVPQEDTLHTSLTVEKALAYSAELRLPGASQEERKARVQCVARQVKLFDRLRLRIGKLSGGQKKRVSVALELLTSPGLLILDEPTSGLDPGLEAQMMELFSNLAREGRVVLVATHAMESLSRCDALLLLVQGSLAYFGKPADALGFFGVPRHAAIFDALKQHRGPEWARRYSENPLRAAFAARPAPPRVLPEQAKGAA